MTEQPKTAEGRALVEWLAADKVPLNIRGVRAASPEMLRRILAIEAEAAAPAEACICTVPGYMPGVDCKYPHLAATPAETLTTAPPARLSAEPSDD